MTRRYRHLLQVAAAGLLAGSATMLLLPASPAAAGSSSPAAVQASWFWQTAYEQSNPPVAPPAVPPSEPSGVPDGDLAVAYTGATDADGNKTPAKMTALSFDTSALTPGSSVQTFTFTLTLDTDTSATSFDQQGATIVACQPTRLWPSTAPKGGDYTDEPTFDCSAKVKPEINGNAYTFKIPLIAQSWVDDQNLGVVVVPDPKDTNAPFQVVFKGAKTIKTTMVFTSGTPSAPAGGGSTGGTTTGTGTTGTTGGGVGTSGSGSGVPLPGSGDTTTPGGGSAPVVASPTPTIAAAPVAAIRPASSAPSAGFWAATGILGALMLLISLVLGDPTPPVASGPRSRLDRVLRERDSAFTDRHV
jgi:hypothetical protein